jgi:hypothetical protein
MENKKEQIPMSLENLPAYVRSLKEKGSTGGSCLVDMGVIEVKNRFKWLKIIMPIIICVALGVSGMVAYNLTPQQFTVVIDLKENANPTQAFPEISTDSGGQIIAVTQKEDATYEVKFSTRKSRRAFLEGLNNNKHVKKAE